MAKRETLSQYPDLMKQWDYEKNEINPLQMTVGSAAMAWWICDKGHSWEEGIRYRVRGYGCPYCSGKRFRVGYNDLQTCRPELINEWDHGKNDVLPSQVKYTAKEKAWWVCHLGHSWEAVIYSRSAGRGCPYCAGQALLVGFNDLESQRPDIASEWDYEKNELSPSQVTLKSGKMIWWKCKHGHSWQAKVHSRSNGCGCPYCSGRALLKGFNDVKTLRPLLIEEWDYEKNEIHPSQVAPGSDTRVWWKCERGHSWKATIGSRSRGAGCPYCAGNRVLYGFNDLETQRPEVAKEWDYEKNLLPPSVFTYGSTKIAWWRCKLGHSWEYTISARSGGYGCPYCSGQRVLAGFNDLETRNPKLAAEWDYEKNEFAPSQVTSGTQQKAWWKCELGHSWYAEINSRNAGKGCPYCAGRYLLQGFNDFHTRNPELVKEWDYDKNEVSPSQVIAFTQQKVWWLCTGHGHSWEATISNRKNGIGCPYCSGHSVLAGFNDLLTRNPTLADEWDHEKNEFMPSQVTPDSPQKAWWLCEHGHSWEASVNSRNKGSGCPFCWGRLLESFNDLLTRNPTLADEWDHEKNELMPSQVTPGSPQKVWWLCEHGHSWQASVSARNNGTGCPFCSGRFPYTPRCVR